MRRLLLAVVCLCLLINPVEGQAPTDFWTDVFTYHGTVMLLIEVDSGQIVRANHAAASFYGYSTDELESMSIVELNTLNPAEIEAERRAAAGQGRNYFVFPHQLHSGEQRIVEVHSYPVDRSANLLYSIIHDITDRMEAQEALLSSNRRLSRAEQIALLGHWEFRFDHDQAVFSEGALRVLGLTAADVSLEEVDALIHPSDLEHRNLALSALMAGAEPYDLVFRVRRPSDGAWIFVRSVAQFDAARNTVFGTLMDITEFHEMLAASERQARLILFGALAVVVLGALWIVVLLHSLRRRRTSEKALRESHNLLHESKRELDSFLQSLPGMAYRCRDDQHWTMLFVSGQATELLGYTPDELVNNRSVSYAKVILPTYRPEVEKAWRQALDAKQELTLTYKIQTSTGEDKWVWEQGRGVFDADGSLLFVEGLIIDITDQKELEFEAKHREQNLQITLQSIGDGVIAIDNEGRITRVNPAAVALTGWSVEEAVGRPLSEAFRIVHTTTRRPAENPAQKVLATGQMVEMANHTSLLAKGGREYHIADSASPILDADGSVQGVIMVFRDVTESYRQRQELEQRERQFRALFEHSVNGVGIHRMIFDDDGNPIDYVFLQVNKAFSEHSGLDGSAIVGRPISEVQPEVLETDLLAIFGQVVTTHESVSLEYYLEPTGKYFDIKAYALGGEEFAVVFVDMTDRRFAEDRLRASETRFRRLVEAAPDAVIVESEGLLVYANKAALALFGVDSAESVLERPVHSMVEPDSQPIIDEFLKQIKEENRHLRRYDDISVIHGADAAIPVEMSGTPIEYNGKPSVLVYARDISNRKKAEARLKYLSFHDAVTGLYNRTYFEEELYRLEQEQDLPLSVVMADVNGLKIVNDSLGHAEGDRLLRRVADIFRNVCRQTDIVARWGGDEFAILLPQTSQEHVRLVAQRIENACDIDVNGPVDVSIAVGWAVKDDEEQNIRDVLKEAEDVMYQSKMNKAASTKSALVTSLQRTLGEKSHETEQHARNLQVLAVNLARRKGLPTAQINETSLVALLHDIGKVGVPESILKKPGPLTSDERAVIVKHPEIGYRIAAASPDLAFVAPGIMAHHEWWDGSGYPQGLVGADIPISARIVAIVDAYEAMISDRPYRQGLSEDVALTELAAGAGTQFDPELTELFLQIQN